jgi:predicted Zn-dependent protease
LFDCNIEAVNILEELIKKNPSNARVIGFLGLFLSKTDRYKEAIWYLEKEIKTKPDNELLFLSLYINYVEVEEFDKAFQTLFRYLENNPADMFKDTLEELLDGLTSGYGVAHKSKIVFHAKMNNVTVPEELE